MQSSPNSSASKLMWFFNSGVIILATLFASSCFAEGETTGDWRTTRVGIDLHRSFGTARAEKHQGNGFGLALLFPQTDSGFDLGFRYAYIDQPVRPFTLYTFVFDYYVFPSYVKGLYVGGEIGLTHPDADHFYSMDDEYVFVAEIGYEYWIPASRWSAAIELHRTVHDEDPIKATRQSKLYTNELMLSARYTL